MKKKPHDRIRRLRASLQEIYELAEHSSREDLRPVIRDLAWDALEKDNKAEGEPRFKDGPAIPALTMSDLPHLP